MAKKRRDTKARKTPQGLKDNAQRKRARHAMEKAGKVRKGDGKDVDHKRGLKGGNGKSNLRVQSKKVNRGRSNKK